MERTTKYSTWEGERKEWNEVQYLGGTMNKGFLVKRYSLHSVIPGVHMFFAFTIIPGGTVDWN